MKTAVITTIVLIAGFSFLVLCGTFSYIPSNSTVARAFSRRHPDLTIGRVIRGDGDGDGFSFFIRYHAASSPESHTAHWLVFTSGVFFGWELDSEDLECHCPSATHIAAIQ